MMSAPWLPDRFASSEARFGRAIPLFRLRGLSVAVDSSVLGLALLVWLSFSLRVFPLYELEISRRSLWALSGALTLGLFASLCAHDLVRLSLAHRLGWRPRGFLFYAFGSAGKPRLTAGRKGQRIYFHAVGILFSALVGALILGAASAVENRGGPPYLTALLFHLGCANLSLAAFQCLPALPLDGGRIWLEAFTDQGKVRAAALTALTWLTYTTAGLIVAAGLTLIARSWIVVGTWICLIGVALAKAGSSEHEYLAVRDRVAGRPVREFMNGAPISVPPSLSLERFDSEYRHRYPFRMFPVTLQGILLGFIDRKAVGFFRSGLGARCVQDRLHWKNPNNTISPDTDAGEALSLMMQLGTPRFLVAQWDRLVGILSYGVLLRAALDAKEACHEDRQR